MKERMQKMYHHRQLISMKDSHNIIHFPLYTQMGLIDDMRDVKNKQEYDYLTTISQLPFHQNSIMNGVWLEGYPLGITPIRSKEKFHMIEFSLENGDFVFHPFALAEGMDENYQKLLTVLNVKSFGGEIPEDILVKKCGFLVSQKYEGGEVSYYLHDVATMDEFIKHRLKAMTK